MAKALKGKRGVVASPTKDYLDILKVLEIIMKDALTQKLASSPGHSQFLMIHAKNEKAWFAKSRAPHLGGRVVEGLIIVRGPVTCLRVDLVLAVPIVPGTSIATVE